MADSLLSPPPIAPGTALLLDFDGTLVDLAETPDSIRVPSSLPGLLGRLADVLEGRLAIVSGRAIADVERHVGVLPVALSGSHGVELRLPGCDARPVVAPPSLSAAREAVARFAAAQGLLVEHKPAGIALHYRSAPEQETAVAAFMETLADQEGLQVQHGKRVVELLPSGVDKGEAVRSLMREPQFARARPVFVGDDMTDEHAFAAAAALGGGGVLVGEARKTAARWRLPGVADVSRWLEVAAG
jgi:trehalose 6-phosphate phosphatase